MIEMVVIDWNDVYLNGVYIVNVDSFLFMW